MRPMVKSLLTVSFTGFAMFAPDTSNTEAMNNASGSDEGMRRDKKIMDRHSMNHAQHGIAVHPSRSSPCSHDIDVGMKS